MSRRDYTNCFSSCASPDDVVKRDDVHKRRRRFIGPIQTTAFGLDPRQPQTQKHKHSLLGTRDQGQDSDSSQSDSDSSSLSEVIHRHALEFFLRHGGRPEDWGESQQKSVRKEMRKRWRQSDWARAQKAQKQAGISHKWIGTSFDVGVFLGVDVMDENLFPSSQPDVSSTSASASSASPMVAGVFPSTRPADTFVTTPTEVPNTESPSPLSMVPSHEQGTSMNSATALVPSTSHQRADEPPSLLADKGGSVCGSATSPGHPNGAAHNDSFSPTVTRKGKGKSVRVHYASSPAPPSEVLERTGSAIDITSAGAAEQATCEVRTKWGDVIMRGKQSLAAFKARTHRS